MKTLLLLLGLASGLALGFAQVLPTPFLGVKGAAAAAQTFLVHQDFEGTGYDNGEAWSPTLSASPGTSTNDPDYTGVILAGAESYRSYTTNDKLAYIKFDFAASQDEVYTYFLFRSPGVVISGTALVSLRADGGGYVLDLVPNTDRTLSANNYSDAALTSVGTITSNTTYHVWTHYKKGTGADSVMSFGFSTDGIKPGAGDNYAAMSSGTDTRTTFRINLSEAGGGNRNHDFVWDRVRVSTTVIGDNPL